MKNLPFPSWLAGEIVRLLDRPSSKAASSESPDRHSGATGPAPDRAGRSNVGWLADPYKNLRRKCTRFRTPSDFASWFLALLSITLFCFPVIGFVLGIGAVWATRDTRGWLRIVSWTAVVVSAIITICSIIAVATHPDGR
jgi:hypothetical protein